MTRADANTRDNGRVTRPARPVSINDVADRASVSIATVSRVLNTPSKVAAGTAQRVQAAIADLGYRPNLFAKGLVTKRSRVIGISLPDLHGDFYSALMRGADEHAYDLGYHLLVMSNAHGDRVNPGTNGFAMDLIDGLVTIVTESSQTGIDALAELQMPVVVLGTDAPDGDISSISFDQEAGAAEATAHLLDTTPPERVMFVGGHRGNLDSDARLRAFMATLRAASHPGPLSEQIFHGEFTVEWGWNWAEQMLAEGRLRGAAVLAGNDEIAVGIVDAARDRGLSVPDDLRVVGFDDSRLCQLLRPTLSSVRVPIREAAARAIDTIVSRLDDPERGPDRITLTTSLAVRDSSRAGV
ncbi:MAG: LacI family transcriptional regulator [Phycisphaeraceae bacterium]|nr:MAG: LacI family transcriptional regulator [Phycisphaeraceae bacterium]